MIIPCIDLMDGRVVQLVQGREKVLERSTEEMLEQFRGFEQIQVIDLDSAMNRGSNGPLVEYIARQVKARVGGGVRTIRRALELVAQGAYRVIVGTAAFSYDGPNLSFLRELSAAIGAEKITIALDSKNGKIVTNGWKQETAFSARDVLALVEPYCSGFLCTYVDKEGMMQGTDLGWFESLRRATGHEIIAAGGITTLEDIEALTRLNIHCAIGMSIYTGRLPLDALREMNAVRASG
ncbi:MAG TPA: 1-(5-phosphoribosyl)-5-[(5-phosphoribosylamino)methylideneamino] imidazole-4-carboxamide isomerase [Bryobacteraceae bacterium]|jgi:phosphoribosylformimino-5-aminoimidazole carboxamide ribotide isomerase|nr:1-(5-phosphoribosyl)-5-[(5-phosphoribosylamino)methylideneamino] imidazole-4-carboxamide isomerase [Bryobacteraceae bacterium]